MKRKIFTFLSAAVLLVCTILPVSAANAECQTSYTKYIWVCRPGFCVSYPGTLPELPALPELPEQPESPVLPEAPVEPETPVMPDDDNYVMAALEQKACELVNQQREANGLKPLTISAELCVKARIKSQDMLDNHYFAHNSPTYGTPFEMMKGLGITYRSAGENIAMGYKTAEAVVNAWMNSEGHRANILSSSYTAMGIGHVDGYWTQWFIG